MGLSIMVWGFNLGFYEQMLFAYCETLALSGLVLNTHKFEIDPLIHAKSVVLFQAKSEMIHYI